MLPKYLIESCCSASSAIYVCRVTSASSAAAHQESEPACTGSPWCQQRGELSGWVIAFCFHGKLQPWDAGDNRVLQAPQLLEADAALVATSKYCGQWWVKISSTAA